MSAVLLPSPSDLETILAEIERWIARDSDPVRTLTNVACLLGNQFRCDACSIYFQDPVTQDLVLCGTVGLRQECVGQIRMSLREGLTGLVAQQRCPVVVTSQAASHPRFRYFPEAGEDLYQSFLGAPILHEAALIGVLVLQTFEEADFGPAEVERMCTAGRMLGPHLARMVPETLAHLARENAAGPRPPSGE